MGANEENIIRYMDGYIPFTLLKVYKKKDSAAAADVVDFFSGMSQPNGRSQEISLICDYERILSFYHSIGSPIDGAHPGPKTDRDNLGRYCP